MRRAFPRRTLRAALVALALLLLAGWFLPSFLSVERYRRLLRSRLEANLGRRVTFGAMSFHLLPRPGFTTRDVLIDEDPRFGIEPFARIEKVDCDLGWKSLWKGRLILSGLDLERPSFNIVHTGDGGWNVKGLLTHAGYASSAALSDRAVRPNGPVQVAVEDGRINFKMDDVKKPFVVDDLKAQIVANAASHSLRFDLVGTPSRSDLMVPSPGPVEISGKWSPGPGNPHPLIASLRLRDSLLYSWLPLITGHNPEIYGLLDGDIGLAGTLDRLQARGQVRMTQVHRWELLPPTTSMPVTFQFQISADRKRQQVSIDQMNVSFAAAHLRLTGSITRAEPKVRMDIVLALQHSRLEDLGRMASLLSGSPLSRGATGDLDGLLSIHGPQGDEQFSGFISARNVVLKTPEGNFRVPQARFQIDRNTARLMPLRVKLAPHFSLSAEGSWGPENPSTVPRPAHGHGAHPKLQRAPSVKAARHLIYRLILSSNSASLHEVADFARRHGISFARTLDLTGQGSGIVLLEGKGWPLSRPEITGRIELDHAQLVAPGLTEPLNFPQAQIQVNGDHITANPIRLVIGRTEFTGSLDHQGARRDPWLFNAQCDHLTIEQAARWFEALGHRGPLSLLARIPGLASLTSRLQAGRDIFGSLNAKGTFRAKSVSYRNFNLAGFQSDIEISNRELRMARAHFTVAGGSGRGSTTVDLRRLPARITGHVHLARVQLATLAPRLPGQFRDIRGFLTAGGDFATRGLSRSEMAASLAGHAQVDLGDVSLGRFDPVQAAAAAMNWGHVVPVRSERSMVSARFDLLLHNGRAALTSQPFSFSDGRFKMGGFIGLGGDLDLILHADLSQVMRRGTSTAKEEDDPRAASANFHIQGSIFSPRVKREPAVEK